MDFNPVDFMNSADAVNIQEISKQDEDKFKDYTDKVLDDLKINHKELMGPS